MELNYFISNNLQYFFIIQLLPYLLLPIIIMFMFFIFDIYTILISNNNNFNSTLAIKSNEFLITKFLNYNSSKQSF